MKHHPPTGAIYRARRLRRDMTKAEKAIWRMLREHFSEFHFRHQVPIRHYIVDFASHRAKIVVEVDGGQHSEEADADRTTLIEAEGYRVLRFWNNDVLDNAEGCARVLSDALAARSPPSNSG